MHCHHEKTIVVDDRVAFVGGIDLTSHAGDRFDTSDHRARGQRRLARRGSAHRRARLSADVAEHFRMRWHEVTGEPLDPPARPAPRGRRRAPDRPHRPGARLRGPCPGATSASSSRTCGRFARRSGSSTSRTSSSGLPRSPRSCATSCSDPPSDEFRLLVVLPAKPNSGATTPAGMLGELIEADAGAGRLLACTLYARAGGSPTRVYVHAKVGIVDDALADARLCEPQRALALQRHRDEPRHATTPASPARRGCASGPSTSSCPLDEVEVDPARVIDDYWKPISKEQLARRQAGEPLTHRLVQLPGVSKRSERLLGPLQGLLVDG